MRRRTDRLFVNAGVEPGRRLGPREEQTLELIAEQPGITIAQLADVLGVGMARVWQMIERFEYAGRIRREGEAPRRARPGNLRAHRLRPQDQR